MKKPLLFVLIMLSNYTAFSQMSGNYNYSLGLRGYTIMQMPKILDESDSYTLVNSPFNGAMVKFNDNQISYRIQGTYYNRAKEFYNNCESCEFAAGRVIDYTFKIGFEKNFNYSRVQPYFGFDIGYRSNEFDGNLENRNEISSKAMQQTKVEATKTGFMLSPVIGFKINPIDQVSFFAEGTLDFFYSYERQERILQDADNTRLLSKFNKTEYLLNPISIGIQIHLGHNK
ncbi:hypothetical protein [Pedobacter metabolipauper]|uniref:Outer membrane protein with beta-barrel domain n=1 Tax=Pedobacter metabolipauper TaxID=425513 RepID=A0A4R6SWV7_9SPHI|nr:hypothetical protein [Pedobacter metabolipauper]TDQ09899.1 hypothetical protein ATK78_2058 [Pedobacter metabolipauper]